MSAILIIGATGKTGARVSQRLIRRGIAHRAVSRRSTPGRAPTDFDTFVQRAVQAGARTSQPERQ